MTILASVKLATVRDKSRSDIACQKPSGDTQRAAILDAVCDIGRHAAIGDIQLQLSQTSHTIDPATIYRNLKVLCEVGLLVSAHTDDLGMIYRDFRNYFTSSFTLYSL